MIEIQLKKKTGINSIQFISLKSLVLYYVYQ